MIIRLHLYLILFLYSLSSFSQVISDKGVYTIFADGCECEEIPIKPRMQYGFAIDSVKNIVTDSDSVKQAIESGSYIATTFHGLIDCRSNKIIAINNRGKEYKINIAESLVDYQNDIIFLKLPIKRKKLPAYEIYSHIKKGCNKNIFLGTFTKNKTSGIKTGNNDKSSEDSKYFKHILQKKGMNDSSSAICLNLHSLDTKLENDRIKQGFNCLGFPSIYKQYFFLGEENAYLNGMPILSLAKKNSKFNKRLDKFINKREIKRNRKHKKRKRIFFRNGLRKYVDKQFPLRDYEQKTKLALGIINSILVDNKRISWIIPLDSIILTSIDKNYTQHTFPCEYRNKYYIQPEYGYNGYIPKKSLNVTEEKLYDIYNDLIIIDIIEKEKIVQPTLSTEDGLLSLDYPLSFTFANTYPLYRKKSIDAQKQNTIEAINLTFYDKICLNGMQRLKRIYFENNQEDQPYRKKYRHKINRDLKLLEQYRIDENKINEIISFFQREDIYKYYTTEINNFVEQTPEYKKIGDVFTKEFHQINDFVILDSLITKRYHDSLFYQKLVRHTAEYYELCKFFYPIKFPEIPNLKAYCKSLLKKIINISSFLIETEAFSPQYINRLVKDKQQKADSLLTAIGLAKKMLNSDYVKSLKQVISLDEIQNNVETCLSGTDKSDFIQKANADINYILSQLEEKEKEITTQIAGLDEQKKRIIHDEYFKTITIGNFIDSVNRNLRSWAKDIFFHFEVETFGGVSQHLRIKLVPGKASDIDIPVDADKYKFAFNKRGYALGDETSTGATIALASLVEILKQLDTIFEINKNNVFVEVTGHSDGVPFRVPYEYKNTYGPINFLGHKDKEGFFDCLPDNQLSGEAKQKYSLTQDHNRRLALVRALYVRFFMEKMNEKGYNLLEKYIPSQENLYQNAHAEKYVADYRGIEVKIELMDVKTKYIIDQEIQPEKLLDTTQNLDIENPSFSINKLKDTSSYALLVGLATKTRDASFDINDIISLKKYLRRIGYNENRIVDKYGVYDERNIPYSTNVKDISAQLDSLVELKDSILQFFFYFNGLTKLNNNQLQLNFMDGPIPLREIYNYIKRIPAKRKILVFDTPSIKNYESISAEVISTFSSDTSGQVVIKKYPDPEMDENTLILFPNKDCGRKNSHSLFTYNLMEAMNPQKADVDANNIVTFSEIIDYLSKRETIPIIQGKLKKENEWFTYFNSQTTQSK